MNEKIWAGTRTNPRKLHAFLNGVGQPAACSSQIYTTGPLATGPNPRYGNREFAVCQRCAGHVATRAAR